jgi:hypothetical protein
LQGVGVHHLWKGERGAIEGAIERERINGKRPRKSSEGHHQVQLKGD